MHVSIVEERRNVLRRENTPAIRRNRRAYIFSALRQYVRIKSTPKTGLFKEIHFWSNIIYKVYMINAKFALIMLRVPLRMSIFKPIDG